MSVILPPVPHQSAGLGLRHGPLVPAPINAATVAGPVATTQMKLAVRPVDGVSEPDRPDFVPAQRGKDRPEPHEWLGPRPSFRLHLLDALPESMDPEAAEEASPPAAQAQEAAPTEKRPVFAEFDAPPPSPDDESRLDLRL
jgi:hypothetical protein